MKTIITLFMGLFLPMLLLGQSSAQKKTYTSGSSSSSQSQSSQQTYQRVQPTTTYQSQPQVQQQTQQTPVQNYQTNSQSSSQWQRIHSMQKVEKSINTTPAMTNTSGQRSINSVPTVSGKVGTVMSRNQASQKKAFTLPYILIKKVAKVNPNALVPPVQDSNAQHVGGIVIPQKMSVPNVSPPRSHEPIYNYCVSPTMRFYGNYDNYRYLRSGDIYGVHIAAFANYNYCVAVSKWLQKKYKAIPYIIEDISGLRHYHLVFGRWFSYKAAEIFEGKVRRDAPNAFVIRWKNLLAMD